MTDLPAYVLADELDDADIETCLKWIIFQKVDFDNF